MLELKNNKIYVHGKPTKNPELIGCAILDQIDQLKQTKEERYSNAKDVLKTYIEESHLRATPERDYILMALFKMENFTAEKLYDELQYEYNFIVSRSTIYNAISLFKRLKIIFGIEHENATIYSIKNNLFQQLNIA